MENEDKDNLIKRSRAGGYPTRLQKHAPTCLDIDKVLNALPSNPFGEASKAIPLLSPLILSPQPLDADITIQAQISENDSNRTSINHGRGSSPTPSPGWVHPAVPPFPEPSSLCSFFQKQCVCVNHAQ
ncbi:uncharacterized protein LOC133284841 [Gastrolobium bilobum]|uniref:uncharacterized protein LOC133284841 n=1 Tax=Gastrolobium bilobum TaxID=150636 RepID=UPI002AB18F6C|nr:uncharacterized protein LOC133284841 [Gastrolobium bilobum]